MNNLKKLLALIFTILFSFNISTFAYELTDKQIVDDGSIPNDALNVSHDSIRTVTYTSWIKSYAIQTDTEANSGVYGGEGFQQISDIAMCPTNENLMLFGTDTSGIWRSTDGGQSWYSVNKGINNWGVHDICFHPTNPDVAYMIQGAANSSDGATQIANRTIADGLYKTEDGGQTWKQVMHVLVRADKTTNRLIAFDNSNNIYVLTAEGLLRSSDGTLWEYIYSFSDNYGRTNMINYDLCIQGSKIVFTNSEYGVFASFDGGQTWQTKNIDSVSEVAAYGIDIDPENSNHWLCCFGSTYRNLYETNNNGISWHPLSVGASDDPQSDKYPIKVMFGKGSSNRKIYMLFKMCSPSALRISSNEGSTWDESVYTTPWGDTTKPIYGHAICLESADANKVYLGVGSILKSEDAGATFTARNTPGFSGACVDDVVFSASNKIYLSVRDRGFYKSTSAYNGTSYPTFSYSNDQSYGNGAVLGIDPRNENHIIYQTNDFSLKESNDGGENWTKIEGTSAQKATTIKFHNENANVIYSTYYTSRNGGVSWNANEKNIEAVSPANNNYVYGLDPSDKTKLYRSTDLGVTWEKVYSGLSNITSVMADAESTTTVWIGTINGKLIKLEDRTATEIVIPNKQANFYIQKIAQNPTDSMHIIIGGRCQNLKLYPSYEKAAGVYETFDGGATWRLVKGLPSMRIVYELEFSPNTNEVFIGGFTGGLIIYNYNEYSNYINNYSIPGYINCFDDVSKDVIISGNTGVNEVITSTILVVNKNVTPSETNAGNIVYINQIKTDEQGNFVHKFKLPFELLGGTYDVYLGGEDIILPNREVSIYDDMVRIGSLMFDDDYVNVCSATALIINKTETDKPFALILAQYNIDELQKVDYISGTVAAGESEYQTVTAKKDDKMTKCSAFIWDSMSGLLPLAPSISK